MEEEECPLTVRDGRMFLEKNYRNEIRHFERKNETVSEDAPFVMRMKDICFRYAKDLPDVLDGVALSVRQGEIISLLGWKRCRQDNTVENHLWNLQTVPRQN